MYLRIIGNSFTENIFKEIEAITDKGSLLFKELKYVKEEKLISLPITRYKLEKIKKIFGITIAYKYYTNTRIKSLIIIRNIDDCIIDNKTKDLDIAEITILFGLVVKDNKIFIYSAEEKRGVTLYSIELKVSKIDIEIRDIDDSES